MEDSSVLLSCHFSNVDCSITQCNLRGKSMKIKGVNILVLGLGRSGEAAADMLIELGANVYVYDDVKINNKFKIIENLDIIELCILSPGISRQHKILKEVKARKIHIISELELGTSFMSSDMSAITRTNGKTTTTMLVTEILKEAGRVALSLGNIGIPVTKYALSMKSTDVAVIEVSSFQLESTNIFKPKVATIINLAPDHLDRHLDYEDYVSCKLSIFNHLDETSRAVINYDNDVLREYALSLKCEITFFSSKYKVKGCYIENSNIYCNCYICSLEDLAMTEPHNIENILCAIAICSPYGISAEKIRNVLMRFKPPEYRMSDRGIRDGKRIINDSKGTNIHSTMAACRAVIGDTALLLGGSDKGEDYTEIFNNLPDNIKYVIVSGDNAPAIIKAALSCHYNMICEYPTLKECIECAKGLSVNNILFSPASASFDRYSNYVERGEIFDSLI